MTDPAAMTDPNWCEDEDGEPVVWVEAPPEAEGYGW